MTGLGEFTLHHVPSCHLKCFHFWFLSGFDYWQPSYFTMDFNVGQIKRV